MDRVELGGMALNVEVLSTAALRSYARNPRTHSPKQIGQIAESIRRFGFTNPILIDANRVVIAGHGRLEAAKLLGVRRVPTIRLDHMTEAEKRAYIIADNKLAENAGWDRELLALELQIHLRTRCRTGSVCNRIRTRRNRSLTCRDSNSGAG